MQCNALLRGEPEVKSTLRADAHVAVQLFGIDDGGAAGAFAPKVLRQLKTIGVLCRGLRGSDPRKPRTQIIDLKEWLERSELTQNDRRPGGCEAPEAKFSPCCCSVVALLLL